MPPLMFTGFGTNKIERTSSSFSCPEKWNRAISWGKRSSGFSVQLLDLQRIRSKAVLSTDGCSRDTGKLREVKHPIRWDTASHLQQPEDVCHFYKGTVQLPVPEPWEMGSLSGRARGQACLEAASEGRGGSPAGSQPGCSRPDRTVGVGTGACHSWHCVPSSLNPALQGRVRPHWVCNIWDFICHFGKLHHAKERVKGDYLDNEMSYWILW